MPTPVPTEDLDLLTRMANAAAIEAGACLAQPVRLARCDALELRQGFCVDEVRLESWPVRTQARAVTILVVATAPQTGGGARLAGTGRFTFIPLTPQTRKYPA